MYIAIDIGATNTRIISFRDISLESEVKGERFPTDKDFEKGYTNIVEAIKKVSEGDRVDTIAISHVGSLNKEKTLMVGSANLPSYAQKPLKENLEKEFSCAVILENDSICAGLAEYAFGEYKEKGRFAYMTISTGMGALFVKKVGETLHIIMADVGHVMVIGDRRECTCGQIDCIEAYASGKSFTKRFLKEAENIDDLRIWERAVEYLAISAVNFITMFRPEVLIFGGGMIENNEYIREKLQYEIQSQLRGTIVPIIAISNFGDKVGVYGALALLKLKPSSFI